MGRYDAITEHLRGMSEPVVLMSLAELDRLVGGLPMSASRYGGWWTNSRRAHPHAHVWLDAGRRAQPDLNGGRVRFTIGSETRYEQRARPTRSTRASAASALLEPTGESLSATIMLSWASVGAVGLVGGRPSFPLLGAAPGIYRFAITSGRGEMRWYIGETGNLARRMGNYRNPGPTQPTNQRLFRTIVEVLGSGGGVDLAVGLHATFEGNALNLRSKAARRLVENAVLVGLELDGASVDNL